MKRFTASILALGLAAGIGTASAQSSGYYVQQYGQPSVDRYGQASGAYYDYARVLRVDPVIEPGYNRTGYGYPAAGQRCHTRQDTYAGNDPYYGNNGYYGNGYGNGGYGNDGYANDGYYGNNGYRGTTVGANVATVIGGLLGAAVGSQVGGGSARYATAAIGSMVGGMAGRQVYESSQRNRYRTGTVQVCDPVPVDANGYPNGQSGSYVDDSRVAGYDVTYEYAGHTYTTRTSYNPGSRIRVRVDVNPG